MVADGLCPWPLFQGVFGSASPLEQLPRAALLPLFQSYCNTNPRWGRRTLLGQADFKLHFREWKPLCLGSKCGGTRLINLAASHEECQCLLVGPQRSFCSTQRGLLRLDGLGALDCKAGDAQGELCCIKAVLRERNRFKRPPAETSCRHHTQTEAFHHISADQVKPVRGFCEDGGVCQGWMLWWDEPDWRAARKASEVGGNVDVVCGAVCFLSQLKTLRNVTDPEQSSGDEQDKAGDNSHRS